MFTNTPTILEKQIGNQSYRLETGLLAQQASSSVLVTVGGTTLLCVVVVGGRKDGDFFPLQVIYEERYYAAGKIKSSQWSKREGRPGDSAVLTGRMIDRSLRSLFNPNIRTEVQVIITTLSFDKVNSPDLAAVLGASTALMLCRLEESIDPIFAELNLPTFDTNLTPFSGPVACVRVGSLDMGETFIINPTMKQINDGNMDLVISGNGENIVMMETAANIVPEEKIAAAIKLGEQTLKELVDFQKEFISLV
jgi:polyribonucleotide nucleotidyltransferase